MGRGLGILFIETFSVNFLDNNILFSFSCRIEHLDKWCRELKILYLQSNLIPKIGMLNSNKDFLTPQCLHVLRFTRYNLNHLKVSVYTCSM